MFCLSGSIVSIVGIIAVAACEIKGSDVVTIQALTAGDRACYVDILDEQGKTSTQFATFEICDRDLVGKKVQLHYESGEIVAEECNGDIDCGLSEIVMLITQVRLVDASSETNEQENGEAIPPETEQISRDLTISSAPLLPTLTTDELTQIATNSEDVKSQWFGRAGFLKVEQPPRFTEALQTYRQAWMAKNPEIAPFLGFWHGEDYQGDRYSLTIFPAAAPGQVCVLEFQPELSMLLTDEETGETVKDLIRAEILSLSVGRVQSGQLQSSQISTATKAIALDEYMLSEAYDVESMGIMDDEGNMHVVAAAAPPTLPEEFPQELSAVFAETLAEQGCTDGLPDAI